MIHRSEFRAMGCKMLAVVESESLPSILQNVPAWFEEWEQVLSRFRSDSELVRLNMNAGQPAHVSQTLWDVFQASVWAEQMTYGLVNPLILDALVYAGYDQTFERVLADPHRIFPDLEAGVPALNSVVADTIQRTILLPRGSHLDFGGVAKGWAAHQAAERLKEAGPALVNAGGDISISGPRLDDEAWHIGVADPFQPDAHIDFLYVERGGVATSGKDYHRWSKNGIAQHHIIDPRTGLPAETDILAATVIAPTAMEAEAMAKAVLISGSQAGLAWLDAGDDLAGLLVLETGERLYSRNLQKYK
ncbi:MAG: FAD:protein FMN transferase [Chloroflexi bacterium]|nr:FAD:protein FMN transferase [Chloroflexota bacterium]